MRFSALLFFLAPLAVICDDDDDNVIDSQGRISGGEAKTGPFCCNQGTPDPSGTCKAMGLNSYACESFRKNNEGSVAGDPDARGGCDNGSLELFPVGRDVKGFVANSTDTVILGPSSLGAVFKGFIGCAE
ncbi:hypothetical protein LZ31DRAFT_624517 [Colletotrichum somersetense]|nr:hypothetical protein LZ31DRAFT_624517 [Colletotrichum somersetense]